MREVGQVASVAEQKKVLSFAPMIPLLVMTADLLDEF
jgi:hypothetical protein